MLNPIEELRFWTGIMRDHGEFILSSLAYNEQEAIYSAKFYKESFSNLHEQSKWLAEENCNDAINVVYNECMNILLRFINYKRLLLRKALECKLDTSLPPTFNNLMINEALEFYKSLINIQCNIPANPLFENLNLHKIWLRDASGHAAIIASELDPIEYILIKEAKEFEKNFNNLILKSEELSKMIERTCLNDGALKRLNEEVKIKISEFICYLNKIRKLRSECKIMGVFKPLIADHMIREEEHYLYQIAIYELS